MKKVVILLFVFIFLSFHPASFAQTTEQVKNFDSQIKILKNGEIEVKETITYFFSTPKHGIYRYIPYTKDINGERYDMTFSFQPVVDEKGNTYKTKISKDGNAWTLKIGNPDKTITGLHTYVIYYTVKGSISYLNDHDELYWNITGNGWDVPIEKAKTTITLPENIDGSKIGLICFTGAIGSNDKNCTSFTNGKNSIFETSKALNPNEGLTVAVSFPKGMVATLLPQKYIPFFDRWYGKLTLYAIYILAFLWYLALPIYLIVRWYKKGRDPKVGIPLTASFDPPRVEEQTRVEAGPPKQGGRFLTPGETGSLIDETVDNKDIFASIVDLARRGFLVIQEKKKKEFYLLQKKKSDNTLLSFEKTLLDGIFKDSENIKLKDAKLFETVKTVKGMLYQSMVDNKYFAKNPEKTRKLYYALGIFSLFSVNFVLSFISFVFGKVMPRKTLLGAQKARDAHSLKNFLTSQKRQLEFQAEEQMMFEKLLPYAIAFGVEKVWAKRFEKINLKQPSWYQGYQTSSFNSIYFASVMSNSFSSFKSSSTPPSSSSGFGGGGFSGGGGGGGGGGSW
jgi:uncharacterized membrane protein